MGVELELAAGRAGAGVESWTVEVEAEAEAIESSM
jgi:hypothetical protein